jgi:glycosyltransferase involved in cell wall biosynthesis
LKILHIIPNLRKGGAERLVIDIVREFSTKKNIDIQLVLFQNKIEYDVKDISQFIHIIPSSIKLSLTKKNEYSIQELQTFIDEFKPDIIHTHLFETEIVSRSCTYRNAKWFTHCHDNMVQFLNFRFSTLLSKKSFTNFYEKKYLFKNYKKNGGTHFISISNNAQNYFKKTIKPYNSLLIPNAIDYQKFHSENKKTIHNDLIKLVTVGSLVDKKNQLFLIDVCSILSAKGYNIQLEILGDGINRTKINDKILELRLAESITLRGNVDNVEDYLRTADIYLHSAIYEPFGLVLLEAMAASLPVICLDGGGNRDIIEQGKNGFIVYENSPTEFAAKIIELIQNPVVYQTISKYASSFAEQYDIKPYVNRLLDFYNKNY